MPCTPTRVFSVMWLIRPIQVGVVQSEGGFYIRSPYTNKKAKVATCTTTQLTCAQKE